MYAAHMVRDGNHAHNLLIFSELNHAHVLCKGLEPPAKVQTSCIN